MNVLIEKKKTSKIFFETLKECCSNSTSHAIPNIARTEHFIVKIFWFILFIAATCASAFCLFLFNFKLIIQIS
jgi:hypothetical protein